MKCTVCLLPLTNNKQTNLSHYKSPFHNLNLKRKFKNLKPLTNDEFLQLEIEDENNDGVWECVCGKEFYKENRYLQHCGDCVKCSKTNEKEQKKLFSKVEDRNQSNGSNESNNTDKSKNSEKNVIFDNTTHEIYLHLPSGTVLGNKKYLIYFKQNYVNTKNEQNQIIKGNSTKFNFNLEKQKEDVKTSVGRGKGSRFRVQWMH